MLRVGEKKERKFKNQATTTTTTTTTTTRATKETFNKSPQGILDKEKF